MNLQNYRLTIGNGSDVASISVVYVNNWHKDTQVGSEDQEKIKQYLIQKVAVHQSSLKSDIKEGRVAPNEKILLASFMKNEVNPLYETIGLINKSSL